MGLMRMKDGLVGILLAVAGTEGDHRLTVHVVVSRFKAKGGPTQFNGN